VQWGDAVLLYETSTGTLRRRLAGHQASVSGLSFSADGRLLATGSEDHTALVWDLTGTLTGEAKRATLPDGRELEALWDRLAGGDARAADEAVRRLSAAAAQSVPFLAEHLRPAEAPSPKQLERLLADLDSDRFEVRQKASQELEALGELAVAPLLKARGGALPAEARRRVEALLEKLQAPVPAGEALRGLRAVEVLEHAGTAEARQLLEKLGQGTPESRLTQEAKAALRRLPSRTPAP
jgi:hypothetical protein